MVQEDERRRRLHSFQHVPHKPLNRPSASYQVTYFIITYMYVAHIYSLNSLEAKQETAIKDGLDLVSQQIGKQIASRTLRLQPLPQTRDGSVVVKNVRYGKLDRLVPFHIFAVPLSDSLGRS